jgi:hypothetical protein
MPHALGVQWMAVFAIAILVCAYLVAAYDQPDPTWLKAVGMTDGNDEDIVVALVWNQSLVAAPSIAISPTPEPLRLIEPPSVETPAFIPPPALVSRAPPRTPTA